MAQIYNDQHLPLKDLLAMAGRNQDATLLIPDLQRPYVWSPSQVTVLVDSLIRGWPFGTLLTWKVKPDDPARELARSFWKILDRTNEEKSHLISKKHPPAKFQMVLDGQQRVQSLLLALGGDGWGFKLPDRHWHELLSGAKARGPRGKAHWSHGCLCVDVITLTNEYARTRSAVAIDYTKVLHWVITDDANGQSQLTKPETYKDPLEKASATPGRFVRLSRLWEVAPEQVAIDAYAAEDIADNVLKEHQVSDADRNKHLRPFGALIMALKDVKQTRVTFLELAEYETGLGERAVYNDAIVNIFTRLNTAGRTLTREDITFAWLKTGWKPEHTANVSAKKCIETLQGQLSSQSLPISVDDIVSAISLMWAAAFNSGKLLSNDDLMKGDAIRPMATDVSQHWELVTEAAISVSTLALERGLHFREHYQSVNALAYLWAWHFLALQWVDARTLKELDKDSFYKGITEILNKSLDRWLICSQWAGVWASSSARSIANLATNLASCAAMIGTLSDPNAVVTALGDHLQGELRNLEPDALGGLGRLVADDRREVRLYYNALWIWNRLDANRWEKVRIVLREKSRRASNIEVDHIVAFNMWEGKLNNHAPATKTLGEQSDDDREADFSGAVNELGNCMLLEKNFNVSKSDGALKDFLDGVHEFKSGDMTIEQWAEALDLDMRHVASANSSLVDLRKLFAERTQRIRAELEQFVRGIRARIDTYA